MDYESLNWYISLKDMAEMPQNNFPKYIVWHHAASNMSFDQVQEYHIIGRSTRGLEPFANIGYHYYITKDGAVFPGRPEHRNGAHAPGYNTKSIGICLQGNYSEDTVVPLKQKNAVRKLTERLMGKYDIPLANILPHRATKATECPGKNLPDSWLKDILVEKVKSMDEFSTLDLLKEARSRSDFWSSLGRLFT